MGKVRRSETDHISGRIPPQDIELEKVVLGAILLDRSVPAVIFSILKPDSFYLDAHRLIFGGMVQLRKDRAPIDLISIVQILRQNGDLDVCGGPFYISQLTDRVASSANIEYHSRLLEQLAIKRRAINFGMELIRKAYDDQSDPLDIVEDIAKASLNPDMMVSGGRIDPAVRADNTLNAIENARNGVVRGYSTNLPALDSLIGGIHKGEFTVIAARPGMGKTAFALYICQQLSKIRVPVFWAQLEMSDVQVGIREIASLTGIDISDVRTGNLSDNQMSAVRLAADSIRNSTLFIDTDTYMNVNVLRNKSAMAVQEYKAGMIVLDYMGLVDVELKSGMNMAQAIGAVSRTCKLISKQYDIPVVALSQLSRQVEQRPGKRPLLSDLRDSGSIEQDADNVLFLYRPEYYGINEVDAGGYNVDSRGLTEVIVGKIRQGKVGSCWIETNLAQNRYGRPTYSDDELQ